MNHNSITVGAKVYDPVYRISKRRKHIVCYVPVEILELAGDVVTYRWNGAITRTIMRSSAAARFVVRLQAGVPVGEVGQALSYV